MNKVLCFNKPNKIRNTKEHNGIYSSDSGIPGTYVPNMSEEDMRKFKAVHIKGEDERIEIRVTIGGTNLNIFVYKETKSNHKDIKISANGKIDISYSDLHNINKAIKEAQDYLEQFIEFKPGLVFSNRVLNWKIVVKKVNKKEDYIEVEITKQKKDNSFSCWKDTLQLSETKKGFASGYYFLKDNFHNFPNI